MQVKLSGFTAESRYVVACNGQRVPLTPTGAPGEFVAGVRYRARQLSAVLHPTIPVHAPLVFDIVDRWKDRSIGRCIYHVEPPDGRIYTTRPGDATEAEDRRKERFQVEDPPRGPMAAAAEDSNPIFPMTLDLRWAASAKQTHTESTGPA
jgi:uncharacterized protein (DUF2126 family)